MPSLSKAEPIGHNPRMDGFNDYLARSRSLTIKRPNRHVHYYSMIGDRERGIVLDFQKHLFEGREIPLVAHERLDEGVLDRQGLPG
jgi:hypothetical protein